MGKPIEITDANFEDEVLKADKNEELRKLHMNELRKIIEQQEPIDQVINEKP